MRTNLMHVSLDTLIAASPLMGHELEDRSPISDSQDLALVQHLAHVSSRSLRGHSQRDLFCVAPLDILVSEEAGHKKFHLLELNGTGIGGLTNLPSTPVRAILNSLAEMAESFEDPQGVVLLAVSGKESDSAPRHNRLMHEKLLFVDALREGLNRQFGGSEAMNLDQLHAASRSGVSTRPAVVVGYIKDFLNELTLRPDGTLWLHGRPVMGAVNDRFCRNLLQRCDEQVDLTQFKTFNRCFAAGSDKGVAYRLMNEYVQAQPHPALPDQVHYMHAECRASLIETVLQWLEWNRQVVIKPHGTGLGHGIEFFFSRDESVDAVVQRIDQSLQQTEEYYGIAGGALPYTVCEYVDACQVQSPGHALEGHKYELRVVVYRDRGTLRAMPSIAKIARERQEGETLVRRALINNITASGDTGKVQGTDYMLPLCNRRTLEMLGLTAEDLEELCTVSTGYVAHVLNQVEDQPEQFGLPSSVVTHSYPALARAA